jgi:hypothetical protein
VLVGFSDLSQIEEAVSCSDKPPFPLEALARIRQLHLTDFGLKAAGS